MFKIHREQYNSNENVIVIPCSCGEHSIELHDFEEKEIAIYVNFSVNKFSIQDGIIKTIWKRLKMAFMILRGKSYRLEEFILSENDIEQLEQECRYILQKKKGENNEQN